MGTTYQPQLAQFLMAQSLWSHAKKNKHPLNWRLKHVLNLDHQIRNETTLLSTQNCYQTQTSHVKTEHFWLESLCCQCTRVGDGWDSVWVLTSPRTRLRSVRSRAILNLNSILFLSKSPDFYQNPLNFWTLSPKISQTYTKSTAPHISGARTHGDWNRWCWWGASTTSITGTGKKRASIAFRAAARGSHRRTTTLQLGWGWGNFGTKRETCEGRGKSQCWRDTLVTCPTSVFLKWGGVVMDVDVMVCCIRSWDGLECVRINFLFITQAFWKLQCVFYGFQKM